MDGQTDGRMDAANPTFRLLLILSAIKTHCQHIRANHTELSPMMESKVDNIPIPCAFTQAHVPLHLRALSHWERQAKAQAQTQCRRHTDTASSPALNSTTRFLTVWKMITLSLGESAAGPRENVWVGRSTVYLGGKMVIYLKQTHTLLSIFAFRPSRDQGKYRKKSNGKLEQKGLCRVISGPLENKANLYLSIDI